MAAKLLSGYFKKIIKVNFFYCTYDCKETRHPLIVRTQMRHPTHKYIINVKKCNLFHYYVKKKDLYVVLLEEISQKKFYIVSFSWEDNICSSSWENWTKLFFQVRKNTIVYHNYLWTATGVLGMVNMSWYSFGTSIILWWKNVSFLR